MNIPDLFCFTWMLRRTTCAQVGVETPWVVKYLKTKRIKKEKTHVQMIYLYRAKHESEKDKLKKMYIYIYKK